MLTIENRASLLTSLSANVTKSSFTISVGVSAVFIRSIMMAARALRFRVMPTVDK